MEVPHEQATPINEVVPESNPNPDWILDSLVAYLRGPVWLTPIVNFVEQNSVVFEGEESEQLEAEYQKIHDNFRNLVDVMLGAYMDDLGLQPEHLENALSQIQPSIRSAALQELLEPVQSAGDYERFKRLMRMKNEQLHNEALETLRKRRKLLNQESNDIPTGLQEDFSEEEINEAIRQSLAEAAAARNKEVAEERLLDRALAASVAELLKTQQGSETLPIKKLDLDPPPITTTPVDDGADFGASGKGKFAAPDPEEVERRRAALRAQRDKILSQKRKDHETKLQQQDQERSVARPRSGRAAQAALAGEPTPNVDDRTIQYRRLLLQKIKEEVGGQTK